MSHITKDYITELELIQKQVWRVPATRIIRQTIYFVYKNKIEFICLKVTIEPDCLTMVAVPLKLFYNETQCS